MLLDTLIIAAIAILVYVTMWFILSVIYKRADVADIAWGPGFVVASLAALYASGNASPAALVVCGLVLIWGLRLGLHIGLRNIRKAEDYRYVAKRQAWGASFYARSYLEIFLGQGLLMLVIVVPVLVTISYATSGLHPLLFAGCALWLVGFFFETVGDAQLRSFLKNPANKGHIMTSGLWKYTRHPNYFGEVTQWWAIGLIALSCTYGWVGLIGPAVITFLIVKVSGVPLLEKKYADRKDWKAYKKRTSMLLPLPPRNS